MANQGSHQSQGSKSASSGAEGSKGMAKSEMSEEKEAGADGPQLDQFFTYLKGNWRPLLTELVAAGVTAYLAYDAKEKTKKKNH